MPMVSSPRNPTLSAGSTTLERRHGPYYSSSPYYFAFYDIAKALQRDKPDRLADYINRLRPDHRSLEDTDSIEAIVAELEYVYNSEAVEDVKLFPGAVQTLQELRGRGVSALSGHIRADASAEKQD